MSKGISIYSRTTEKISLLLLLFLWWWWCCHVAPSSVIEIIYTVSLMDIIFIIQYHNYHILHNYIIRYHNCDMTYQCHPLQIYCSVIACVLNRSLPLSSVNNWIKNHSLYNPWQFTSHTIEYISNPYYSEH